MLRGYNHSVVLAGEQWGANMHHSHIFNYFMSKRNFILLIIILIIAVALVFVFLYTRPSTTVPGENVGGTNFGSQFNPFGNSTTKPPTPTPPINISENPPQSPAPEITVKLKKVSSMPIAGFIIFTKERLKDVPIARKRPPTPPEATIPLGQ